ncbi:hypothetical protein MKZ38_004501 [Zalerion maritima]|uniref:Uncharacterized protein n=1 Tax=Zalerion maritima TaxID=339359 RepID=A0AAD5RMB7_9PEZI|nr:hypothetical protein MKZ38_004501 [Zalerion maritima]
MSHGIVWTSYPDVYRPSNYSESQRKHIVPPPLAAEQPRSLTQQMRHEFKQSTTTSYTNRDENAISDPLLVVDPKGPPIKFELSSGAIIRTFVRSGDPYVPHQLAHFSAPSVLISNQLRREFLIEASRSKYSSIRPTELGYTVKQALSVALAQIYFETVGEEEKPRISESYVRWRTDRIAWKKIVGPRSWDAHQDFAKWAPEPPREPAYEADVSLAFDRGWEQAAQLRRQSSERRNED